MPTIAATSGDTIGNALSSVLMLIYSSVVTGSLPIQYKIVYSKCDADTSIIALIIFALNTILL
jgi:hypothetical protein